MKCRTRSGKMLGASMVEFLIVTPLLLLLGLGTVQIGLIFYSKNALNFALQEAARSGAVNHADIDSVRNGLLRGLVPFMGGGTNAEELASTLAKSTEEFTLGTTQGWIRVQQFSPMAESFSDWEEDSTDEEGNAIREIPNASLAVLRCTRAPNGGVAGVRASTACGASGERIGTTSQQTLSDANLLRLQMTYSVKMVVPIINRIVGRALAMAKGCIAPEQQRIGPLNLGTPQVREANVIACAAYNARDASGNPAPRIPISLSLTVRMQSTARSADSSGWFTVASRDREANTGGVQLGNGEVDAASEFAPIQVAQLNPNGVSAADDGFDGKGNGSVHFGTDTDWRSNLAPGNGAPNSPGAQPPTNPLPPVECTPSSQPPTTGQDDGFFGSVWSHLQSLAGTAYDFVRGFWEGIKNQAQGLIDMLTDPIETAKGMYELAMAFIEDPQGTAKEIGTAIGRDLSTVLNCGAYDRGRLLGENVSPAFMLKLAGKLARFGRGGLQRAVRDTRREIGRNCTSFGPETLVMTETGLVPITAIKVGDLVRSRSDRSFEDSVQRVTTVFGRVAPHYRKLVTERDTFEVTDEHPFWVQGKGWVDAKDVDEVDVIAAIDGDLVVIKNLQVDQPLAVRNFSVANNENYFVGESGVWVHNAPCLIDHQSSDGRNPVLNRPQPNTRYYVDGRHIYQTDDLGRTTSVTSRIEQQNVGEGIRNCYQQRIAGACDRLPSDDGGHLIGTYLGGPGERVNLVPQNLTLNRGAWRTMEMDWAELADQGKRVDVTIRVEYDGDSLRPTRFIVDSIVDGVPQSTRVFRNN